jgi:hypothetical protein
MTNSLDEKAEYYSDAGPTTLPDGSAARIIKLSMPNLAGISMMREVLGNSPYKLLTIRKSDGALIQVENVSKGEVSIVTRRVTAEAVAAPGVPWNLAGLEIRRVRAQGSQAAPQPELIGPSVSVQQMAALAGFETYVFATDPAWTTERRIMAHRSPMGPTDWMFVTAYRAKDIRHVALIQTSMYTKTFGPALAENSKGPMAEGLKKNATLVYASPKGFKVWSMMKEARMGPMLLTAVRDWLNVEPLSDSPCYLVRTPADTIIALAVNGAVADDDLRTMIDSLVPAKEYGKKNRPPAAAPEKSGTTSP